MKTFKCFAVLAAFLTIAAGCQKEPQENPDDNPGNEKQTYEIAVQESDLYSIDVPDSAKEGDEVTVSVTLKENAEVEIVSVKYNEEACEFVSEEGLTSTYSFTMPSEDVSISVETAATVFAISWEDNDIYTISGLSPKAKPGDVIEFNISVTDLVYKIAQVTYGDGLTCKMEGEPVIEDPAEGPLDYTFSFTMPENDVTINVTTEENMFRIYRTSPDHAAIKMLTNIKTDGSGNPATDSSIEDENDRIICEGKFGDKVYFTVDPESEQWSVEKVTVSSNSGSFTVELTDSPYGKAYSFTMKAEEVSITAALKEEESNIYEGKDFVGNYSGFIVKTGFSNRSLLYSAEKPTLTYTLSASASYSVTESEDNSYNGTGKYIFNEGDKTFTYDEGVMQNDQIGLSGTYLDDMILVTLKKIGQSISYDKTYIAAMDADGSASISDFVSAADDMGYNVLISFNLNGQAKYYLYEQVNGQTYTPVTVSFTSGSSLDESGVQADVIKDGEMIYKYSLDGTTPVFRSKGNEAGTYEGPEGTLILDGFGSGTLDGASGTYSMENNVATFIDSDQNSTKVVLNYEAKTYTIYYSWDGPMYYSATTENADNGSGPTEATVIVDLASTDWSGNPDPIFRIETEYAFQDSILYTYDPSAGTLTITFVDSWSKEPRPLQGNPDLSSIVFKVSEDKQTLEMLDVDKIINAYGEEYGFITVSGMKLTAGGY